MSDALPTGRRGQLLALGLTLLVLAAVWVGIASPLVAWYAGRAETLMQRRSLERRMSALAHTLPALRRQASAVRPDSAAEPAALLQGTSDAMAGASLQQRVQDMAGRAGVALTSVETLPVAQEGAYRRIGLRLTLSASWPVLVHLLQAVEQAAPRMLVDDLQLQASAALVHPEGLPINATFTVLAFRAGTPP